MSEAEMIKLAWFQPWHFILYLFVVFTVMVVYYEWRWAKTAREKILALIARSDGSSYSVLVPKSGGSVSLQKPGTDTVLLWPINKLACIDVLYPGVGFVPTFLQKQIRMVILDEDDWEPLINRNPDRALIASPAFLGNLLHQKISEIVLTVNKEMIDRLEGVTRRLNNMVSPTMFYAGIGIVLIAVVFLIIQTMNSPDMTEILNQLGVIQRALGVTSG